MDTLKKELLLTDVYNASNAFLFLFQGEELPRYRLRADHRSDYVEDYHSQDENCVIETPVLSSKEAKAVVSGLTPGQAEATLEYFVACGDRLSQMTKTYHDVESVSRYDYEPMIARTI